jgi:hypothetical protein
MKRIRILHVLAMMCFFSSSMCGLTHARDVVILYDTSGSTTFSKEWQDIIRSANEALDTLISKSDFGNSPNWIVSHAPGADKVLVKGERMLDPQKKDKIIIHYFDEPESCEDPFFKHVYWFSAEDVAPGWLPKYLPAATMLKGKFSFLALAKWSAANKIRANSAHHDDPFFLIIVSDGEEDVGGKCRGNELIARKQLAFKTFYSSDPVLSAAFKNSVVEGKHQGKFFQIDVSLVAHKTEPVPPTEIPAIVIPDLDDPDKNSKLPDPPTPISEQLPGLDEPDLDTVSGLPDDIDGEKRSGFPWGWAGFGLASIAAVLGGAYAFGKKMMRPK